MVAGIGLSVHSGLVTYWHNQFSITDGNCAQGCICPVYFISSIHSILQLTLFCFFVFFISHGVFHHSWKVGQFRPAGSKWTDHKSQALPQKLGGTSDAFHYNSEVGFSSFAASYLIAPLGFRILESWRKLELGIQYDRHVYQQCFDKHSSVN